MEWKNNLYYFELQYLPPGCKTSKIICFIDIGINTDDQIGPLQTEAVSESSGISGWDGELTKTETLAGVNESLAVKLPWWQRRKQRFQ